MSRPWATPEDHDAALSENDSLTEQVRDLRAQVETLTRERDGLLDGGARVAVRMADLQAQVETLTRERDEDRARFAQARQDEAEAERDTAPRTHRPPAPSWPGCGEATMGDWRSDAKPPEWYEEAELSSAGEMMALDEKTIANLRAQVETLMREHDELCALVERWECESHPWTDANGDPITDVDTVRKLTDRDEAGAAAMVASLERAEAQVETLKRERDEARRDEAYASDTRDNYYTRCGILGAQVRTLREALKEAPAAHDYGCFWPELDCVCWQATRDAALAATAPEQEPPEHPAEAECREAARVMSDAVAFIGWGAHVPEKVEAVECWLARHRARVEKGGGDA